METGPKSRIKNTVSTGWSIPPFPTFSMGAYFLSRCSPCVSVYASCWKLCVSERNTVIWAAVGRWEGCADIREFRLWEFGFFRVFTKKRRVSHDWQESCKSIRRWSCDQGRLKNMNYWLPWPPCSVSSVRGFTVRNSTRCFSRFLWNYETAVF